MNTNLVNRFVGPHETLLGFNRYNTVFTEDYLGFVNQWKLTKFGDSSVARQPVIRESKKYIASLSMNQTGEDVYETIKKSQRVRRIYRGINKSNKNAGWVRKVDATHFDVYEC
jgi:hypothetical protein